MNNQSNVKPWWAALVIWVVVNAVNLLQAAGFLSRVCTGDRSINHLLGYVILALVVPSTVALVAFVRAGSGWRHYLGPLVFIVFIGMMLAVDFIWMVEFRSPMRSDILVPYLLLFFGAIFLMGIPMFRMNRRLWLVTAITTVLLLGFMVYAMYMGVG